MDVTLIRLLPNDADIPDLLEMHRQPSVAGYLFISERYFDYVTTTDGIAYYKIFWNGSLAGGIHIEKSDRILYLSIFIDAKYRRSGIAETALNQLFSSLADDTDSIVVSVEKANRPSLSLFQKLGFLQVDTEDELITLRRNLL